MNRKYAGIIEEENGKFTLRIQTDQGHWTQRDISGTMLEEFLIEYYAAQSMERASDKGSIKSV